MIHVVRKLSGTLVRNCCKLLPLGGASIVAEDSFHSSDTIPRISDLVWNARASLSSNWNVNRKYYAIDVVQLAMIWENLAL